MANNNSMKKEITIWGIRGGREGEAEFLFEKESVVAMGWREMGDMSDLKNREDFKKRYKEVFPRAGSGTIPIHAGMLYRFVHEMQNDDIIVFPLKLKRPKEVWIGRVMGGYQYNAEAIFPHIRKVEWLKKYPRTKFSQGALYEIGAAMTMFQVKNYADEFLAALEGKRVIGAEVEDVESVGLIINDIKQQSRDFVLKQITKRFKGHNFSEFVGHILDLMGYKTKISPPGPDRGIDIVAYKDDLGVNPPTIFVQVKSSEKESNESEVSQLYGKVTEKDFGLFVSLAGFNKNAYNFAFGKRNLRLIDGDELIDLIYKYYDQIDGKYKVIIPLKKVYIPETPSE